MLNILTAITLLISGSDKSGTGGCGSCIWILGVVFFIIAGLTGWYLQSQKIERAKRQNWLPFAQTNNLMFIVHAPGRRGASIEGDYRGYQLELFTERISQGKSSYLVTCMKLTAPSSSNGPVYSPNGQAEEPVLVVRDQKMKLTQVVNRLAPNLASRDFDQEIKLMGYTGASYQEREFITSAQELQAIADRLTEILDDYRAAVDLEGEAMPRLVELAARHDTRLPAIILLIQGIAQKTAHQVGRQAAELICPHCLAGFSAHRISFPYPQIPLIRQSATYYGCRVCSQSHSFSPRPRQMIAVLDAAWSDASSQQADIWRVNWLTRRELFDFDRVEIVQATDEEVERLAVQVGNDTDPVRKPRYGQMSCTIGPECHLSENTRRILRRTFGEVITHADNL